MNQPGIAALIAPTRVEDFLDNGWPNQPLVIHGQNESVSRLIELPFLSSLEALLNSWPHAIQAHLPDCRDESNSIDTNSADAKKLYTAKMSLLFNNVERVSPDLSQWINAILRDLGLPASTYGRCLVYATPKSGGTATHFDQNINFVLQIHGTKKWWLAPNTSFCNPTQRHALGQILDSELASYIQDELPRSIPTDAEEILLEPGSMLFVPRGFWHKTEALSDALALNFTFSQPTWVDVFTIALRSRLLLSPEWRELANGVGSTDPARRRHSEKQFDRLLVELVEDLPNWRASDILGATEGT